MATFRDAHERLCRGLRLRNRKGNGTITFDVYWNDDQKCMTAEVQVPTSAPFEPRTLVLEPWSLAAGCAQVEELVARCGFSADGWEVIPLA